MQSLPHQSTPEFIWGEKTILAHAVDLSSFIKFQNQHTWNFQKQPGAPELPERPGTSPEPTPETGPAKAVGEMLSGIISSSLKKHELWVSWSRVQYLSKSNADDISMCGSCGKFGTSIRSIFGRVETRINCSSCYCVSPGISGD